MEGLARKGCERPRRTDEYPEPANGKTVFGSRSVLRDSSRHEETSVGRCINRSGDSVGSLAGGVYPVGRPSLLGAVLSSPLGARTFRAVLRALGRAAIAAIKDAPDEPYLCVRLRGVDRTLWWPSPLARESLYIVAQEQAYPWNPHNYEIPQSRVHPDDVVLDCGAAEGLFGLRVIDRCFRLILVEPLNLFVQGLRRTFAGLDTVTIIPAALSDHSGTALLEENGIASRITQGSVGTPVETTTIDALCACLDVVPTFIKADLEGWEPAMIRGARKLLARHKPRLAITTYDDPSIAKALVPEIRTANPSYTIVTKGVVPTTRAPFMLHAW